MNFQYPPLPPRGGEFCAMLFRLLPLDGGGGVGVKRHVRMSART